MYAKKKKHINRHNQFSFSVGVESRKREVIFRPGALMQTKKILKAQKFVVTLKAIIKALFDVKIFAQNEFVIPCHPFGNKIDEKYFRGSQKCYFYPHIIYSKEPIQGVDEAMFKLRVEICQVLCFPG